MAAATKLFQFRPKSLPITTTHHSPTSLHLFSSSSTNHDPDSNPSSNPTPPSPPPQSQSPHSSFIGDIKASLKQQEQQRNSQSQVPRRPFSFSYSHPNQSTPPPNAVHVEEIRKNLSEFRRRTAAPPPPSYDSGSISAQPGSPPQISFQKLYERNKGREEGLTHSSGNMVSLTVIRDSLSQIKASPMDKRSDRSPMYLSKVKQSLNMRTTDSISKPFPNVIGGSDNLPLPLPLSVFGPEMKANEDDGSSDESRDGRMRTEFLKMYDHKELGEKLRFLRPENKGGKKDWFSLEELSERLVKLREMEERESKSRYVAGVSFRDLRQGLFSLKEAKDDKAKKNTLQRVDILGILGRTPGYMLSPPNEVLVEKYFHPDNMSASEKLKLELSKVRDEFKMSESDCGSARVQVAQLTTKIKHLSTSLHKKDKHSRKGLEAMVQRRKKLLKYMRRTDWDSYCFVLSKLGLRDNPDYKN